MTQAKVALITGGAKRIGAGIVEFLHAKGMNIILHYRNSSDEAEALATKLNQQRPNSVYTLQLDLLNLAEIPAFIQKATAVWGYFDVLINNASSFYKTAMGSVTAQQWDDLMASNLTAPFFLSQASMLMLEERQGTIINIVDVHADRPAKGYPAYNIAKAGLWMLTKTLAKELAPRIRVNAIAPGAMIRPANDPMTEAEKKGIPLQNTGTAIDIAKAVYFLIEDAPYVTGSMLVVDGGRSLFIASDNH